MDHSLHFLWNAQGTTGALVGSYNGPLVVLSILLSVMSSYIALELAGKLAAAGNFAGRGLWLWVGAMVMGCGIWAMHFVGMMAFELPVPITYRLDITLISVLPGILASYLALVLISQPRLGLGGILLGGVLFGAGIGAMHYIGMFAMLTSADMVYRIDLFLLSVVAAVILAILALLVRGWLQNLHLSKNSVVGAFLGAAFMGAAIASMHYIAMKATIYLPGDSLAVHGGLSMETLSLLTATISIMIGLAVVIVAELDPDKHATV